MAPAPTVISVLAIILAVLFIFATIVIWFVFIRTGNLWLQAVMSGAPVTASEILGMRFRGIDARVVVRAIIMAKQAGVAVACRQMESAYLQGADLGKLTLAMIQARRQGMETTFEELVAADLEDRLAEKLGRPVGSSSRSAIRPADTSTAIREEGPSVRTCRKCSKQVADDSKICRNCGAIL